MENDTSPDRPTAADARAALEGLDADGARLADRVVTPWWYHPVLGLIVATLAFAQAIPSPGSLGLTALAIIAIPALMLVYRQLYGVTLVEPAGPRSRRVLTVSIVVMVVSVAAALVIRLTELPVWWGLIPAFVGFVGMISLGRVYDAALREELAAGADARP